jgi:hypothetical protein
VIADRFSFADIGCSSAKRDFRFAANLQRAIPAYLLSSIHG